MHATYMLCESVRPGAVLGHFGYRRDPKCLRQERSILVWRMPLHYAHHAKLDEL
jgi:hypothetical protein